METNENIILSRHRTFHRNYTPVEFLGEVKNLTSSEDYDDFLVVAIGSGGLSIRIGSRDRELRYGDLIYMLEKAKLDILELEGG